VKDQLVEQPSTNAATRECTACGSKIPKSASVCKDCKSYQSRWKARLQYGATIAGLVSLVFYGATYFTTALPELRKTLFWRDRVVVTALNSMREIVISNSGDGEVFVSHLTLTCRNPQFSQYLPINKTLKPKTFLVHDFGKKEFDWQGWGFSALTEDQWRRALTVNIHESDPCFRFVFFCSRDAGFLMMQAFNDGRLRTLPVQASLAFYRVLDGRLLSQDVSVIAAALWKKTDKCGG
jgi:hypothetical protein